MEWHFSTIWVDLHAIAMLALPITCAVFLFMIPKRRPPGYALAVWTVGLGGLAAFQCTPCLCIEKHGLLQVIIPATCLWLIALFVAGKRARHAAMLVCVISWIVLPFQHDWWAGDGTWTSVPSRTTGLEKALHKNSIEDAEMALLEAAKTDNRAYGAMWFSDLPGDKNVRPDEPLKLRPCRPRSEWVRCWHTRFTGLYLRHVFSEQDYWYLGGPLAEAAGRVTLKDRQ